MSAADSLGALGERGDARGDRPPVDGVENLPCERRFLRDPRPATLRRLSRRVRVANSRLISLASLDVPGRVASELLSLAREVAGSRLRME